MKIAGRIKKQILQKHILLLLGLALAGLLLRLNNFSQLFYYTMDEEAMNLIQRQIVLGQHYPLIGSVSPLGTYLGPIFYYFGALILWLSNLNPLGQEIFAIFLGTANIFLIYLVGRDLFSRKVGIFAAAFYSLSSLMILFDRRFWHLTPGPFLSLLVLWSIFKIKHGKIRFIYLLTAALIFGWNTDYTNLILFLFTGLAWIIFKLPVRRKEIAIALAVFLVSNLPLAAFELRHNFLNTKAVISYLKHEQSFQKANDRETLGSNRFQQVQLTASLPFVAFSRLFFINSSPVDIPEQHTYCKPYILERIGQQGKLWPFLAFLLIAAFAVLVWRERNDKKAFGYKLVLSFYLIFQLGVLFYAAAFGGDVFEHYLATLFPYFFLISAVILAAIHSRFKLVALTLVALFAVVNISASLQAQQPLGFNNKLAATRYALDKVGNADFSLDALGTCFRYDGFYYPFLMFGRHPVKSYQDPNYAWLFDYPVAEKHPAKVVVMVAPGKFENQNFWDTYNRYQQWVTDRARFGGVEVLILDNSKGEFH